MRVWKLLIVLMICAGMILPAFAVAVDTPEQSDSITEAAEEKQEEPAAEDESGADAKADSQEASDASEPVQTTGTDGQDAASEETGTDGQDDASQETGNDGQDDASQETGSDDQDEAAQDPEEDPDEAAEVPVPDVKIIFKDGDTILQESEIPAGSAPKEVPQKDKSGSPIASWIANGERVSDPTAIALSADAVYLVWHAPALNTQTHMAYINGKGGGEFAPNSSLTRGEAAKIIYSLLQDPSKGQIQTSFSDVSDSEWYSTPVYTLSSLGVINGYEDGTFRPTATITRAEFVTMFSQFVTLSEGSIQFSDVPTDHWARQYIVSAAAKGWVSGNPDGTFLPSKAISRAEAVKITNAVLGRDASAAETQAMIRDNNINPFADVRTADWFYDSVMEAATEHAYTMDSGTEQWTSFKYNSTGLAYGVCKIGTVTYAVDQNGQVLLLQSGFRTHAGKLYYVTANGTILNEPGLRTIGEELYYIQADASLAKEKAIGNFNFNSAGQYTTGNVELDNLVKSTIRGCTTSDMTQYQKLRACYLYLRENCRYLSRAHHPRGSTYWTEESALFMFKNHKGNCYCFAGAFYYMAKQLGYDPTPISGGWGSKNQDHAWVMINGRMFDPEIEYAYLYRFSTSRYYNTFDIDPKKAPFIYYFPK